MPGVSNRTRLGALALVIAGVLFFLYPALRPWHDELTEAGALAALGSGAWLASHLFAMIGFTLVPLGLLALRNVLTGSRDEPIAFAAAVIAWFGTGLTLPFYGAETFALNALAGQVAAGKALGLVELSDAIRYGASALTTFGMGLTLLAVGTILAAVAVWRSTVLPRLSGAPLALGFVLFLPQFFLPPAGRIAHGVLMAIGSVWLGLAIRRAMSVQERVVPAEVV